MSKLQRPPCYRWAQPSCLCSRESKNYYALRRAKRLSPRSPVPKRTSEAGSGVCPPMPPPPVRLFGVPSRENQVLAPAASPPVKLITRDPLPLPSTPDVSKVMFGPSYPVVPLQPPPAPDEQAPSPSKKKASAEPDEVSVMELIVAPLLFVTPTSVSSTPSYGLPLPTFVTLNALAAPPL